MKPVPESMTEVTRKRWAEKHKRDGGRFISGPLPLPWFSKAAQLPGKALAVGLALWYMRGITHSDKVTINSAAVGPFGMNRLAVYRGLQALEAEGLITVDRHRGRSPVATIRKIPKVKGQ